MDVTKIENQVSAPQMGDDGEAVLKNPQNEALGHENEPKMPDDAGWYVAVVRCNCENTIGKTLELYFQRHKIWFEYWVPMQRMVVIDKRSNKRRVKEKVLLTTFIFCHVSPDHLDTIRFRSDVYKMLSEPGKSAPYAIPDTKFDNFSEREFEEKVATSIIQKLMEVSLSLMILSVSIGKSQPNMPISQRKIPNTTC